MLIISKKEAYRNKNSHKYFTGYSDNDISRLLCKRLVQMTGMLQNSIKMQQCLL